MVVAFPLKDVLDTYVKQLQYIDNAFEEETLRNFVNNLKHYEGAIDDEIYDRVAELCPVLGCPLTFYKECFVPNDTSCQKAHVAAKKLKTKATKLTKEAQEEFENKRRCVEFEIAQRKEQLTTVSSVTTAPKSRSKSFAKVVVSVGDYVKVKEDLSPGKCSHGGTGFVIAVDGDGGKLKAAVKYDEGMSGTVENDVPLKRITVSPVPLHYFKANRKRKATDIMNIAAPSESKSSSVPSHIEAILKDGASRGMGKGWRARSLGFSSKKSAAFKAAFRHDAMELKGYLRGAPGFSYQHSEKYANGKFKPRAVKHNPLSMAYLSFAWGVGKNFLSQVATREETTTSAAPNPTRASMIDNRESARLHNSAKNLYIRKRVAERDKEEDRLEYDSVDRKERIYIYREEAKAEWVLMNDDEKEEYRAVSRELDANHPFMRDKILEALRANSALSYERIASNIGDWCTGSTIQKWMSSHDTYSLYMERCLPLLSAHQREKHVEFSKRLRNNWELPRDKKYLWVNYDEKWFWGLVMRATAKKCEELGLEKAINAAYHKNHIDKVMVVAVTAYAFDSNVENGGDGLKLGLFRVQGARVAKMLVRKSRRTEEGRIKRDGNIVRRKGDVYLVDCTVTGSNSGTSSDPKFSLKELFEEVVFDAIAELVRPGGKYEGYTPIIQGDNAGPHQDAAFVNFCKHYCQEKGWHWEPQAAQMPYSNNCDLAVFPTMSRDHGALLKTYSNTVAPPEEIWRTAQRVWEDLPSAKIARGYVLAYRIAEKVIKNKGDNAFLSSKDFHCKVRPDFYDTQTGIKRKTRVLE